MHICSIHVSILHTDPETAVTELEKRVEQLETEKLELIKVMATVPNAL